METLRLSSEDPDPKVIERAALALGRGGLVIYPTDTLYALGCRADDGRAARRVREAKGRDEAKPLPLVAADLEQVERVCSPLTPQAALLARRFWPGPLTLVLKVRGGVAPEVTGGAGSVAIRVPALDLVRRLCQRVGPLVSTSANRSGALAPRTCAEAVSQVGAAAALALDAGPGGDRPSTIVDASAAEALLVRAGAIPWEDVVEVLRRGSA